MDWSSFNPHKLSKEKAFEALCNQLFDNWLTRTQPGQVKNFIVVNGSGGDGGVESYAELFDSTLYGLQAKWFFNSLNPKQVSDIKNSVTTAMSIRPGLKHYIICMPRDMTNKKMVADKVVGKGAKKVAESSDYDKIESLKTELKQTFPNLDIEVWNDYRLLTELQQPENIGVEKYWFSDRIVDLEYLKTRFADAKAGWLNEKYISNLHLKGRIQVRISERLYTTKYRKAIVKELKHLVGKLHETEQCCYSLLTGINDNSLTELRSQLANLRNRATELIANIEIAAYSLPIPAINEFDRASHESAIAALQVPSTLRWDFEKLFRLLSEQEFENFPEFLTGIATNTHTVPIIFCGHAGTGKSHALANAVEQQILNHAPALAIEAKNCPAGSWSEILKFGTDAFQTWEAERILQALSALTYVSDIVLTTPGLVIPEHTRFLIAIDGLDEAPAQADIWKTRIAEAVNISKRFPRIQFVFSCRNEFANKIGLTNGNLGCELYELPDEGDVPVYQLFEKYATEYNTPNAPWIGYALTNQLSLRLFCELFRDKRDEEVLPVQLALNSLLKRKIKLIEREFISKHNLDWIPVDEILLRILIALSKKFNLIPRIERKDIISEIISASQGRMDANSASLLVEELKMQGILTEVMFKADDLAPATVEYNVTYQSIIEFLLAKDLVEQVKNGDNNLPETNTVSINTLRIASEVLISDYKIFPGEDGVWPTLPENIKNELSYRALVFAPAETVEERKVWAKRLFEKSEASRNQLMQLLILPASQIRNHPLGTSFLHELLSSYPTSYTRDVVWSGPDAFGQSRASRISTLLKDIGLYPNEPFDAMPLVFAWALSTVDNLEREKIRSELTVWASNNISGFQEILIRLFGKFDPQIDEDLSSVLLGLAAIITKPNNDIKQLAAWISDNIFNESTLKKIRNVIIRHGFRCFMEKAYLLGLCDKNTVESARPGYNLSFEYLPLDIKAGVNWHEGRYPIVHDLNWYVIKQSYEGFLEFSSADDGEGGTNPSKDFLDKIGKHQGQSLSPKSYAVAAAIAYIHGLGDTRTEGNHFTEATHGSKSKVSTFEEKYTWLAVHHIRGYLSDYLGFTEDYNQTFSTVTDYSKLVTVPNPIDGIENIFFPKVQSNWIIPTEIAPPLNANEATLKQDIKSYVEESRVWDFSKWINIPNALTRDIFSSECKEWVVLDGKTSITEKNNIAEVSIHSTAFLIDTEKFDAFIDCFKKSKYLQKHSFRSGDLKATTDTETYLSPIDALWMKWIPEIENTIEHDEYVIYKTITEIIYSLEGEEQFTLIPSKKIRKLLNIASGNRSIFVDSSGNIVGFVNELGEAYYDQQTMVLVDKSKLTLAINDQKLKIAWLFFEFNTTTLAIKNQKGSDGDFVHSQNCRLWLVWEEKGEIKSLLFWNAPFTN